MSTSDEEAVSLLVSFQDLPDPRVVGRCDHKLIDIIVIAVCGAIAGAETWVDIAEFGRAREDWLSTLLELPNGIPSHDTFGRFFAALDGDAFQRCFIRWVEGVFRVSKGQVIAIDGKTARRSHDRYKGRDAIHLVNAWATTNGVALGQWQTEAGSNEITAIPVLLRQLSLAGCIVTIDAIGTQTEIARTIREQAADYVLRVKSNQENLLQDIEDWFTYADNVQFAGMTHSTTETVNKAHGRIETRRCWAISDPAGFPHLHKREDWADLSSLVRVTRQRQIGDTIETETAYFISSLPPVADTLLMATRHHWAVENSLHWVLDVIFREDQARTRSGYAAQNMALLRKLALNIIKNDKSRGSIRVKRYRAALRLDFLEQLLLQV